MVTEAIGISSVEATDFDPTTERMKTVLESIGCDSVPYKTVNVAGTNGKGTTVHFLADVLQESGLKVGVSSDLIVTNTLEETIKVNGKFISESDFQRLVTTILSVSPVIPTQFELRIAVALKYFYESNVDIAVIEAGIGGRTDPTAVVNSDVSIITSVGLDHVDELGGTKEQIAREKAGIISENSIVVSNVSGRINEIIKRIAKRRNSDFHQPENEVTFETRSIPAKLEFSNRIVESSIIADYQVTNINAALKALQQLDVEITTSEIVSVLTRFTVPSRMELVSTKHGTILYDGAHNPHAAVSCAETISELDMDVVTVFAPLADRDWKQMVSIMSSVSNTIIYAPPTKSQIDDSNSYVSASELQLIESDGECADSPIAGLEKASKKDADIIFVTGALAFTRIVKKQLV